MTPVLGTRRVGEHGLLVELGSNAEVHLLARELRAAGGDELVELVPGHETLLVVTRWGRMPESAVLNWEPRVTDGSGPGRLREIPVVYDGADLLAVARECGMSIEELIARHQAALYTVAFTGFAPGFAYLIGGDSDVRPARCPTPRSRIPSGSVAVAGEYSAVYPYASPGGWRLLGHTEQTMFDVTRDPPAYLCPGDTVRFVGV